MNRAEHLTDPDALVYVADAFGDPMAAIHVHTLDDWAWILERVHTWLTNASEATCDDYTDAVAERFGPYAGPTFAETAWMLSAIATHLRLIVGGASS
jgi:hypothetical protein